MFAYYSSLRFSYLQSRLKCKVVNIPSSTVTLNTEVGFSIAIIVGRNGSVISIAISVVCRIPATITVVRVVEIPSSIVTPNGTKLR